MSIKKVWGLSEDNLNQVTELKKVYKLKHGMLASIPLVCKNLKCPYLDICKIEESKRVEGERCLQEIAAIVARFEDLCSHFGIENVEDENIAKCDVVDVSMIRDVVDLEIQILRSENKIAIDSDFMSEKISQIDRACNPYYENVIHPSAEYKLKLIDSRNKILSKLNGTRKDKINVEKTTEVANQKAQEIVKNVKERLKKANINIDNIDYE